MANNPVKNPVKNPNANGTTSSTAGSDGTNPNAENLAGAAWNPEQNFLYFYHPDHLGTTGYVTDQNAKLYEHLEYFPFGETWVEEHSNTQRTPYLFTGKELDEETQLYYYGARYYDPRTSVWQSAAPILGKYLGGARNSGVFNPSNLALFTYSYNNPIVYVDPDGLAPLNDKQRQAVVDSIKGSESFVSHMYVDTTQNVTIGYGHMVESADKATALPLQQRGSDTKATVTEIKKEFEAVTAATKENAKASYYKKSTKLDISEPNANKLMLSDLAAKERQLGSKLPNLTDYPVEAQQAIIDMGFNIGATGLQKKFPKMMEAIKNKNWSEAAKQSNRPDVSDERNSWVKGLFEKAAKDNP